MSDAGIVIVFVSAAWTLLIVTSIGRLACKLDRIIALLEKRQ